jgi:hypothetical protein
MMLFLLFQVQRYEMFFKPPKIISPRGEIQAEEGEEG